MKQKSKWDKDDLDWLLIMSRLSHSISGDLRWVNFGERDITCKLDEYGKILGD